ncbi:MAG: hypothetical protein RL266_1391 [Bacteroidota bacterium]
MVLDSTFAIINQNTSNMKKTLLSIISLTALALSARSQCVDGAVGSLVVTTGYNVGQSFTAPCSGVLTHVEFTAGSAGIVPGDYLYIYAGGGTSTSPIHTQAFTDINVPSANMPIGIDIVGSVPVTMSSQYTFAFNVNLDLYAGIGSYAGGDGYQDGTQVTGVDLGFGVEISVPTGVTDHALAEVSIFPNPTTDVLNISTTEKLVAVNIYASNGALVRTDDQTSIDVSALESGLYLVQVQTKEGVGQVRFVKQ